MTMFVFATNYACTKMCRGCSTPYCFLKNCFLHKIMTMLVSATKYACNKCVMVALHFIGGFVVVVCREYDYVRLCN